MLSDKFLPLNMLVLCESFSILVALSSYVLVGGLNLAVCGRMHCLWCLAFNASFELGFIYII